MFNILYCIDSFGLTADYKLKVKTVLKYKLTYSRIRFKTIIIGKIDKTSLNHKT